MMLAWSGLSLESGVGVEECVWGTGGHVDFCYRAEGDLRALGRWRGRGEVYARRV